MASSPSWEADSSKAINKLHTETEGSLSSSQEPFKYVRILETGSSGENSFAYFPFITSLFEVPET
jgi:hypothetical protein